MTARTGRHSAAPIDGIAGEGMPRRAQHDGL
jgi:hypothetical protein